MLLHAPLIKLTNWKGRHTVTQKSDIMSFVTNTKGDIQAKERQSDIVILQSLINYGWDIQAEEQTPIARWFHKSFFFKIIKIA
jgi:hypothetical protein